MAFSFAGGTDAIGWGASGHTPTSGGVAFFLRTTSVLSNVCVFSHFNGALSTAGVLVLLNSANANKITGYAKSGPSTAAFQIESTTSVNDGNWHHVALNWSQASGASTELYVDGVLEAQANNNGSCDMGAAAAPGFGNSPDSFWGKYVGEIAEYYEIVDDKFDLAEIKALALGADGRAVIRRRAGQLYAPLVRTDDNVFNQFKQTAVGTSIAAHPRVFK